MWAQITNGTVTAVQAEAPVPLPAVDTVNKVAWISTPEALAVGWVFDGMQFVAPAPTTRITYLQLLARLTPAEEVGILAAALSQGAVLGWLLQAAGASFIDLANPLTISGVNALASAGLLTAPRAAVILTP